MPSSLNLGMLIHALRVGNDGRNSTKLGKLTITGKGGLFFTPKANPATCAIGDLNVNAAGVPQFCSASNTWSSMGEALTATDVLFITPKANPGTCTKGALNVGTDGKLYVCSATDTWTVVGSQT